MSSGIPTKLGSSLNMQGVSVGYGKEDVLSGIDLSLASGEFVALLGSSGCGKTTLMRAIAGFMPARAGQIVLNDRDISKLPPEKRGTAMMFQSYALWPHMTIEQNVGYGLKLRGVGRAEIAAKVDSMLDLVGLRDFKDRKPGALSGGQRQRVALARALSIDPPVLLLDEPLSNLDAGIRSSMRHEIRTLQQRLGLTAIMVTHDQTEAMSMADRIVVLKDGGIAQIGTPEDIYHRPATSYVARFMGAKNEAPVRVTKADGRSVITLEFSDDLAGEPRQLFFRSDAAVLSSHKPDQPDGFHASGRVLSHNYLGSAYRHTIELEGSSVMVDHPHKLAIGSETHVYVSAEFAFLFSQEKVERVA